MKELDKLAWGPVKYGNFLATILSFIIVALVLFLIIKGVNRLKEEKKEAPQRAGTELFRKNAAGDSRCTAEAGSGKWVPL